MAILSKINFVICEFLLPASLNGITCSRPRWDSRPASLPQGHVDRTGISFLDRVFQLQAPGNYQKHEAFLKAASCQNVLYVSFICKHVGSLLPAKPLCLSFG
jgi:hypothetical protein